eukprot:CAMPEP_0114569228 /NCGR_PEP_ID=MMETSP0114-20121206/16505_1 /TAXON_ID=31324 /ORGANISM="Goniomonas sp, Strain m" /LENGTH=100 /DNA_ID=CAMNT_0001756075 /DNA_START=255 /DNA_END=557 /DNA_ORIENTATION=+
MTPVYSNLISWSMSNISDKACWPVRADCDSIVMVPDRSQYSLTARAWNANRQGDRYVAQRHTSGSLSGDRKNPAKSMKKPNPADTRELAATASPVTTPHD